MPSFLKIDHEIVICVCSLRFRISKTDIISSPETHEWSPSLFSEIQDSLPGIIATRKKELFEEITYPRFVSAGDDMVLSFRIGKLVFIPLSPIMKHDKILSKRKLTV